MQTKLAAWALAVAIVALCVSVWPHVWAISTKYSDEVNTLSQLSAIVAAIAAWIAVLYRK